MEIQLCTPLMFNTEAVKEATKSHENNARRATGENVALRRVFSSVSENSVIGSYLHKPSGQAKLAGYACIEGGGKDAQQLARMLAMHVVTMEAASEEEMLSQPFGAFAASTGEPIGKVGNVLKAKNASLLGYCRCKVGEGIEVNEVSFEEEVAQQISDSQKD